MNDGGPAFPQNKENLFRIGNGPGEGPIPGGMSLRDWFAGMALSELAHPDYEDMNADPIARRAYLIADAMLQARQNP